VGTIGLSSYDLETIVELTGLSSVEIENLNNEELDDE
jgi:hypothetical protein